MFLKIDSYPQNTSACEGAARIVVAVHLKMLCSAAPATMTVELTNPAKAPEAIIDSDDFLPSFDDNSAMAESYAAK
jgi:hypothetical protein